jgi:hypothetical protein
MLELEKRMQWDLDAWKLSASGGWKISGKAVDFAEKNINPIS